METSPAADAPPPVAHPAALLAHLAVLDKVIADVLAEDTDPAQRRDIASALGATMDRASLLAAALGASAEHGSRVQERLKSAAGLARQAGHALRMAVMKADSDRARRNGAA